MITADFSVREERPAGTSVPAYSSQLSPASPPGDFSSASLESRILSGAAPAPQTPPPAERPPAGYLFRTRRRCGQRPGALLPPREPAAVPAPFLQLEIDAVFAHGVPAVRRLRVFRVGTGYIERAGRDFIPSSADLRCPVSGGNIMNFKAPPPWLWLGMVRRSCS